MNKRLGLSVHPRVSRIHRFMEDSLSCDAVVVEKMCRWGDLKGLKYCLVFVRNARTATIVQTLIWLSHRVQFVSQRPFKGLCCLVVTGDKKNVCSALEREYSDDSLVLPEGRP